MTVFMGEFYEVVFVDCCIPFDIFLAGLLLFLVNYCLMLVSVGIILPGVLDDRIQRQAN